MTRLSNTGKVIIVVCSHGIPGPLVPAPQEVLLNRVLKLKLNPTFREHGHEEIHHDYGPARQTYPVHTMKIKARTRRIYKEYLPAKEI
jgi:hypothetical protein